MANITNYLNKIKSAVYGKEVRGAIHDAIKQVYDDASVNHDNANMEVKMARGTHNTLNERLDNVDEIQAQTNAQLSQKLNKNSVLSMANMGQDIKEAMTGGSVAVVGKNMIVNDNIVDDQISFSKCDFINREGIAGKRLENVAFTVEDGKCYFVADISKTFTTYIFDIEPNVSYCVSTSNNNRFRVVTHTSDVFDSGEEASTTIAFNDELNSCFFTNNLLDKKLFVYVCDGDSDVAVDLTKATGFKFEVQADGLKNKIIASDIENKSITTEKCSFLTETDGNLVTDEFILRDSTMVGIHGSDVFVVRSSQTPNATTIRIPLEKKKYIIKRKGISDRWRICVLDTIPDQIPDYPNYIVADRVLATDYNGDIEFTNETGKLLFIYISSEEIAPTVSVEYNNEMNFAFKINGNSLLNGSVSKEKLDFELESLNVTSKYSFIESVSLYNSPDLPSVAQGEGDFYLGGSMANEIHSMFDKLIGKYPNYVTKFHLGNDAVTNKPIYEYRFIPETCGSNRDNPIPNVAKIPKIIITGGIHGEEKQGVWALIKFFEELCDNWGNVNTLEFLRWNIDFRVIPIVNPNGYDRNIRENGNNKDLNREFTYSDEVIEKEALYVRNWIDDNLDAFAYLDLHTMWAGKDRNIAWLISPNGYLDTMSNSIISKLSRKWKKQYEFITFDGLLGYIGEPDYEILPSKLSQSREYAFSKGILNSITLEIANHVNYSVEPKRYGKLTTNMYGDLLGNTLVALCIKLGCSYK